NQHADVFIATIQSNGDDADNLVIGTNGDDSISGLGGSDTLEGGAGNDTLNGGADLDVVNYAHATGGVIVDLNTNGPQNVGGGAGTDELVNIEYLSGSAFDDTLIGNGINNYLAGGDG